MPQDLLAELSRRGIKLRLADSRLDVLAPAGSLTPELRDQLRLHRDQLIGLLRRRGTDEDLPQITPQPAQRHEPFPLTDIQHAYWVGHYSAVELGGVFTHTYFEFERDSLDLERLGESLRKVIARHDMLRAVVLPDGRQRILPEAPPYQIAVTDLRDTVLPNMTDDQRAAELSRIREQMSYQAPPPDRCPMFDIRASRLGDRHYRLHLNVANFIVDQVSLGVMFGDWHRFYDDPDWDPEPLELSYRDYVLAEESQREGSQFAQARDYWLSRLDELPSAPQLPLAKQPTQLSRPQFTPRRSSLARDRWDVIKRIAQRRGITPSAVLMTVFSDVLALWVRQDGFTLNLTLFNRQLQHPQVGHLVGDFTTVTLLAADPRPDQPFGSRARRIQQQFMRDLEHVSYSGIRVLQERGRRLGGGPAAAMPVVFTSGLANTSEEATEGDREFLGELVYSICETPQVWLDHQVAEEHGAMVHEWYAVEELFPDGLLDDMMATYDVLLGRLSDGEDAWDKSGQLAALPLWQDAERASVNDTTVGLPARTLCELVEEQARQRPQAIAIACEAGQFTYQEIVESAHRLARRLAVLGVGRGDLVAVVLEKGPDQASATLGIMESGAAYLPIEPEWPQARRCNLIELGKAAIVVTSPRLRDEGGWPAGITLVTLADAEVRESAAEIGESMPSPDDLAYVIFTSGSTGQPKGVMIDHRGAANTIADINSRFGVGPDDRVLALSALSFDLSVYDLFGTMAAGGTIVLPTPGKAHDPQHWTELVRQHGITIWNSVPALMQAWIGVHDQAGATIGRELRLVLLSGDWIPVTLPDAIRAGHPGATVISLGGATEASIWSVCYPIGAVPPEWSRIPYGKPLANQRLHVLDALLEPCPVWATGEIYIGGTGLAKGYWADPDKTAERFVVHPVSGERLYRTGDLGRYLPGGDIEFLGREDFQVKLNGYRIELGEIASGLRRQPGVSEALASVEANPATGARQLVAHVVPAAGLNDLNVTTLRNGMTELLPDYMVPRHYLIIDKIPLNANGKVDFAALPKLWDGTVPAPPPQAQTAPSDEVERKLHAIWQEALGRDDIGVEDNLFELGGDSLHAVHILSRMQEELALEGTAEDGLHLLFDNPTIAELAAALREFSPQVAA